MHHDDYSYQKYHVWGRVKPASLIRFAKWDSQKTDNELKIGTTNVNQGPENGEASVLPKTGESIKNFPVLYPKTGT